MPGSGSKGSSAAAPSALRVGVVADDLTGAADTGVQFAARGLKTLLLIAGRGTAARPAPAAKRECADAQVLVLNTASRHLAVEAAASEVRRAFTRLGSRAVLFKKVDSTLRGQIGAELEAALEATGGRRAVFCAAYPRLGRTTVGGIQRVHGLPVAETEAGRDLRNPVTDSAVLSALRQHSSRSATVLGRRPGEEVPALVARLAALWNGGFDIVAADALDEEDLMRIAAAGLALQPAPLFCGCAGLAGQVAQVLAPVRPPGRAREGSIGEEGFVLVVAGSRSESTRRQLRYLGGRPGVALCPWPPGAEIDGPLAARASVRRSLLPVVERRGGEQVVVLLPPERSASPATIAEALAGMAVEAVCSCGRSARGLVLTGGDTAEAVLRQLGVSGMWLEGEVLPGIPAGRLYGGAHAGMRVVTKAGGFGGDDALWSCARHLRAAR